MIVSATSSADPGGGDTGSVWNCISVVRPLVMHSRTFGGTPCGRPGSLLNGGGGRNWASGRKKNPVSRPHSDSVTHRRRLVDCQHSTQNIAADAASTASSESKIAGEN